MKRTIILLIALSAFIFTSACKKDEEDTTARDTVILLALANSGGGIGSLLTPQQQQSTAAASAASSAAGSISVTPTSAFNDSKARDRLFADILNNGKDPLFARQAVKEYVLARANKKNASAVQLAFTTTPNGTANGYVKYDITDSNTCYKVDTVSIDLQTYLSYYITSSCPVTYKAYNGIQGTQTANAVLTFLSATSMNLAGTIAFDNCGTTYTDYYSLMQMMKNAQDAGATSVGGIPGGGTVTDMCSMMQMMAQFTDSIMPKVVLGGTLTVDATQNYVAPSSGGTYSATQTSTVDSTDFTIDGTTVTLENLVYGFDMNITMSAQAYAYTGSLSISITGTVNGAAINDTLTVQF
jgi:hypothetical protein